MSRTTRSISPPIALNCRVKPRISSAISPSKLGPSSAASRITRRMASLIGNSSGAHRSVNRARSSTVSRTWMTSERLIALVMSQFRSLSSWRGDPEGGLSARSARPAGHRHYLYHKSCYPPLASFVLTRVRTKRRQWRPPIWRRLVAPLNWRLDQLHLAIQAAFNWWNSHLHEFRIGGLRYGDPDVEDVSFEDSPPLFDEREVTLRDFGHDPSVRFVYTYDLGDNWRHIVEIEEWLTLDDTPRFAACLDGARARPPEDAGGVSGYEAFLEIMSDPLDAEHTEMKRWCGGHFDPEWFDLGWVDRDVRNALRPTRAGGCTSPNQEAQAMDQRHRRPRRCPSVGCIGFDHPLDWPRNGQEMTAAMDRRLYRK